MSMRRAKEVSQPPDPATKLSPEIILLLRCFIEAEAQPSEYRTFIRTRIDPHLSEMFQVMTRIMHECQDHIDKECELCPNGEANVLDDHGRTIVSIMLSEIKDGWSYVALELWYAIYLKYHSPRSSGDLKPVIKKITDAFESRHIKVQPIRQATTRTV